MPHTRRASIILLLPVGLSACSGSKTPDAAQSAPSASMASAAPAFPIADAATASESAHEQGADMGLALTDVASVGDAASGSTDSPESHGVKTHSGADMGEVNVRAREVASDAIRPAATELAKLTVAHLAAAQ